MCVSCDFWVGGKDSGVSERGGGVGVLTASEHKDGSRVGVCHGDAAQCKEFA